MLNQQIHQINNRLTALQKVKRNSCTSEPADIDRANQYKQSQTSLCSPFLSFETPNDVQSVAYYS